MIGLLSQRNKKSYTIIRHATAAGVLETWSVNFEDAIE